jgi:hypothetical protein
MSYSTRSKWAHEPKHGPALPIDLPGHYCPSVEGLAHRHTAEELASLYWEARRLPCETIVTARGIYDGPRSERISQALAYRCDYDAGQVLTITRAQWDAEHSDYKMTASESVDNVPKVLRLERAGTCLVRVWIED